MRAKSRFPDRLVGFLSVDPLQDSALAEIEHWRGRAAFRGLKLHLTASSVDLNREQDRQRLSSVIAAAAAQQLPIAIHLGGGSFGKREGELFIRDVLAHAGKSWVQITHATGGEPIVPANHIDVLRLFAAIVRLRSLGLDEEETARIAGACAPWACQDARGSGACACALRATLRL